MDLDAIGVNANTDKSSILHDFLKWYEAIFASMRCEEFCMLEIGVNNGASLDTFSQYFPNATIIGLDVNPEVKAFDLRRPNAHIRVGDAGRLEVLDQIVQEFGHPDIVLDDGSHLWHHQIECLRYMWPRIKPRGFFIMEDVHTSFPHFEKDYRGHSNISTYDYLLHLQRWIVGDRYMGAEERINDGFVANYYRTVEAIYWHPGTCILKKRAY